MSESTIHPLETDLRDIDTLDGMEIVEMEAERSEHWLGQHSLALTVIALFIVLGGLLFWQRMVVAVYAGQEAVLWKRFGRGTDLSRVYGEGMHLIAPWNNMQVYDMRLTKVPYSIEVLSQDGLNIGIDLAILYRPLPKALPYLHQTVGPDYVNRVVIPEVMTAVRDVVGKYRPQDLYTTSTDVTEQRIVSLAAERIGEHFIELNNVLIARVVLPPLVQAGVQKKLAQEQEALEYVFRLDKERKESERLKIEADAIKEWETTVKSQLNSQILQYKGIQATLELAKSPNTKVIVVGGKDGLPVLLNQP
jgi:regulator of protease activity HflC (stomatin/prohibitin superfamily)